MGVAREESPSCTLCQHTVPGWENVLGLVVFPGQDPRGELVSFWFSVDRSAWSSNAHDTGATSECEVKQQITSSTFTLFSSARQFGQIP
jgi:hypothetical protein